MSELLIDGIPAQDRIDYLQKQQVSALRARLEEVERLVDDAVSSIEVDFEVQVSAKREGGERCRAWARVRPE